MWESGGEACVGWKEARFEALEMSADALRRRRCCQQCCGHFRCDEWTLDDCCSERGKRLFCSDVTSCARIGHICRRIRFVIIGLSC